MDGHDPAHTNVHFFIDETEVSDVAVVDGKAVSDNSQSFIAPNFQKVELGWQYWHDDGAHHFTGGDLWLDDVVIDDQRIHCPSKGRWRVQLHAHQARPPHPDQRQVSVAGELGS